MKKITLNLLALLVTCCMWQVSAQTTTSPPMTTTVDISGLQTVDAQNDPDNTTISSLLNAFASETGCMNPVLTATGVGYSVTQTTIGSSWLSEMRIAFDFDQNGVNETSVQPSGTDSPGGPEANFSPISPIGPFVIDNALTASVDIEFWESFVDVNGAAEGTFNGPSSLTIQYTLTCDVVPPPVGAECAAVPTVIAPATPGASYDVIIPITSVGTIGEDSNTFELVNVFLDQFQHDTANELQVMLTAPDGVTSAMLFDNLGGTDGLTATKSILFEDGANDITTWTSDATFADPYEAQGGPFNGETGGAFQGVDINGDWTLTITNGGNAGGSLVDACILLEDRGLVGTVPTITCPTPNPFMTEAEPGLCTAEVVFADASAVDVEDGPLMVVRTDMTGLNSGDQFPVGTTTISFMVTDSDGNSAECDFDIIVEDTQAPTVTCAGDITQDNDAGNCDAMVTVPAPVFMDNCPVDSADISNDSPFATAPNEDASGVYPVGTTTVTYSYTDSGGNTITCSVDVTVEDAEAPEIVCEGGLDTVTGTETASPAAPISVTLPPTVSTITVADDFEITDLNVDMDITHTWTGDLTVTLTSPAMTSVVLFNQGCSANDLTFTFDDEGTGDLANCTTGSANDAYPEASYVPSNPLSAFDGESTMGDWTLTVADDAGGDDGTLNAWGLTYSYLFGAAPPYEVTLMDDGTLTIPASDLIVSATDNCSPVVVTAGGVVPPCSSGNGALSDLNTGISGGSAAPFIFANDFTVDAATNFVLRDYDVILFGAIGDTYTGADVTYYADNAGVPGAIIGSQAGVAVTVTARTPFPFATTPPSEYISVNIDVTDITIENMSATVETYWIGINPTPASGGRDGIAISTTQLTGAEQLTSLDGGATFLPYSAFASGTQGDSVYSVNGLCIDPSSDPSMVSFTCDNVGDNTVTVTVTDDAGNSSTCDSVVTVIDDTAPVVVCMDFTLELDDNGVATLDPNDAIDEDATVEACGYEATASQTDFSCADIGTPVVVDIFVIDPSGNVAACTATITVVDVNGPVTECPDDQTVDPEANGVYTLEDFTGLVTATDGCDGNVDVISQSPAPGTALGVGTYTITMTSTDSMGNEGTCTFELTVNQVQGVGESELSAAIALYPNPATEIVNLSNNSTIALDRAAIYNVNGQLVSDIDLDGMIGERTIDVSSLASGVYMVQVSGENNVVVKRLIIE